MLLLGRYQLITELCRPLLHVFDLLLFILLLIFVHTQRIIFHFVLQHFVHHPAIACAVATVAWAGPKRDRNRRYNTPNGQSAFFTELAAMRNACPARFLVFSVLLFNTLPPEISCLGANPSHELKCFSVGNFSPTLLPTSIVTVCASDTPIPSTRLKSTPLIRYKCSRISLAAFGAFLL